MAGVFPRRDGHSSGTPVAGRLEQPTRATRPTDKAPRRTARRSYSVLLPAGLAVPPTLPPARCALTAPFHPCPDAPCGPPRAVCFLWRFPWGRPRRTLSGAASVWSPDFPPPLRQAQETAAVRPTGGRGHRGPRRRRSSRIGCVGWKTRRDPRPRGTNGMTCSLKLHSNYGSVEAADGEALHRRAPTFGQSRRDKTGREGLETWSA